MIFWIRNYSHALYAQIEIDFLRSPFAHAWTRSADQKSPQFHANKCEHAVLVSRMRDRRRVLKLSKVKKERKKRKNLKSSFSLQFDSRTGRLIAGRIDRDINITIFVYVSAQRFKNMFFSFEIAWRVDGFQGKAEWYHKQLTKCGGNKVLWSRPRDTMFCFEFCKLAIERAHLFLILFAKFQKFCGVGSELL